jgi:cysteine-rich repeat protein
MVTGLLTTGASCAPNPYFVVLQPAETGSSTSTDASSSTASTDPTDAPNPTESPSGDTGADDEASSSTVPTGQDTTMGSAVCGDGVLAGTEECDDGNTIPDDGCSDLCLLPMCGDGLVQAGEDCDDANDEDDDSCIACITARCGDGVVQADVETCDDGAENGDYGLCGDFCEDEERCGDGVINGPEGCDDGNEIDDDACSNECVPITCGDGIIQEPETCDDDNSVDTDECTNKCQVARCGDGILHEEVEECDDADGDNTDECVSTCKLAVCGDGVVRADVEACDDANQSDLNACEGCALVAPPNCGNGALDPGEECDGEADPLGKYAALCSESCMLDGCLRVINTAAWDAGFAGNHWLDICATAGGDNVLVALFGPGGGLAYAAEGVRPDGPPWSVNSLTAGQAGPENEYSVAEHEFLVPMTSLFPGPDVGGSLMISSRIAVPTAPYDCLTALGDGYGIGLFTSDDKITEARLLVMGEFGGQTGKARVMEGFDKKAEIGLNLGGPMLVCKGMDPNASNVVPFNGTFVMAVF